MNHFELYFDLFRGGVILVLVAVLLGAFSGNDEDDL